MDRCIEEDWFLPHVVGVNVAPSLSRQRGPWVKPAPEQMKDRHTPPAAVANGNAMLSSTAGHAALGLQIGGCGNSDLTARSLPAAVRGMRSQ